MKSISFSLLLFSLGLASTTALSSAVQAQAIKVDVEHPNALHRGLDSLIGKTVSLRLRSGEEISGTIEAVGPSALRLGSLVGKDFYSAIIRIDDVIAVIYRAKDK